MLHKLGVGPQLVIAFLLVTFLTVFALTTVTTSMVSKSALNDAFIILSDVAEFHGEEFRAFFEKGLALATDNRAALEAIKKTARVHGAKPDRQAVITHLETLLANNPWSLATWTAWEPEKFDGLDTEFVSKPGHDSTGRLVPYIFREGGGFGLDPLEDYDQPGPGDYYLLSRNSGRDKVLEPYDYNVGGKNVLITSMTVPVSENQATVGVAGTDVSLEYLADIVRAAKPMGVGKMILVSSGGIIVGHPDSKLIGRPFRESPEGSSLWSKTEQVLKSGEPLNEIVKNGWEGGQEDATAAIISFSPGETGQRWGIIVLVPMSKLSEGTKALTRVLLGTGALALLGGFIVSLVALKFIVGGLTKRITNVAEELDEVGTNLNHEAVAINGSTQHLSEGTQAQAASIEETSAAMEEISSMTKSTLDSQVAHLVGHHGKTGAGFPGSGCLH